MTDDNTPMVNLVPVHLRQQRLRARWAARWCILVILTIVLVALPSLYVGGSAALTDAGMSEQIQSTRTQVANHEQAIPQLERRLSLLRAEQEVLDIVGNRVDWRRLLEILISTGEGHIRFSGVGLSGAGVEGFTPIELRIDGYARSQSEARDFIVRLEETGLFDRVRLTRSDRRTIDKVEVIEFTVHIGVGETPGQEQTDAS